jgi:hypothetical protein
VHLSGFCRFGSDVGNEEVPHAYHNLRSSGRHVVAGNGEFLHVGRFPSHSLVTSRSNRPYRNHSRTRRIMSSTYDGANPTVVRQRFGATSLWRDGEAALAVTKKSCGLAANEASDDGD